MKVFFLTLALVSMLAGARKEVELNEGETIEYQDDEFIDINLPHDAIEEEVALPGGGRRLYITMAHSLRKSNQCKVDCIDKGLKFCGHQDYLTGICCDGLDSYCPTGSTQIGGKTIQQANWCSDKNKDAPKEFKYLVCPNEVACGDSGNKFIIPPADGTLISRSVDAGYEANVNFVLNDVCAWVIRNPEGMGFKDWMWIEISQVSAAEVFVFRGRDYTYEGDKIYATLGKRLGMVRGKDFYVVAYANNIIGLQGKLRIRAYIDVYENPNQPSEPPVDPPTTTPTNPPTTNPEPTDPEPTNPKPTNPEPTKPTNSTSNTTTPTNPGNPPPTDTNNGSTPTEPNQPQQPSNQDPPQPTNPTSPTNPTNPSNPNQPPDPTPTDPAEPANPNNPGDDKSDGGNKPTSPTNGTDQESALKRFTIYLSDGMGLDDPMPVPLLLAIFFIVFIILCCCACFCLGFFGIVFSSNRKNNVEPLQQQPQVIMYPSFDQGGMFNQHSRKQGFSQVMDEEDYGDYGFSTQRSNARLVPKQPQQTLQQQINQLMNRVNAGVASEEDIRRLKVLMNKDEAGAEASSKEPAFKEDQEAPKLIHPQLTAQEDPLRKVQMEHESGVAKGEVLQASQMAKKTKAETKKMTGDDGSKALLSTQSDLTRALDSDFASRKEPVGKSQFKDEPQGKAEKEEDSLVSNSGAPEEPSLQYPSLPPLKTATPTSRTPKLPEIHSRNVIIDKLEQPSIPEEKELSEQSSAKPEVTPEEDKALEEAKVNPEIPVELPTQAKAASFPDKAENRIPSLSEPRQSEKDDSKPGSGEVANFHPAEQSAGDISQKEVSSSNINLTQQINQRFQQMKDYNSGAEVSSVGSKGSRKTLKKKIKIAPAKKAFKEDTPEGRRRSSFARPPKQKKQTWMGSSKATEDESLNFSDQSSQRTEAKITPPTPTPVVGKGKDGDENEKGKATIQRPMKPIDTPDVTPKIPLKLKKQSSAGLQVEDIYSEQRSNPDQIRQPQSIVRLEESKEGTPSKQDGFATPTPAGMIQDIPVAAEPIAGASKTPSVPEKLLFTEVLSKRLNGDLEAKLKELYTFSNSRRKPAVESGQTLLAAEAQDNRPEMGENKVTPLDPSLSLSDDLFEEKPEYIFKPGEFL